MSWTQLFPTGPAPAPRYAYTAVEDQANDRMIIFGGENTLGNLGALNDVWVLSNADGLGGTPAWTQLTPLGTPPNGGQFANAVYDPSSNRMIVFGGDSHRGWTDGLTNNVWVLSNADGLGGTPQWTQLAPTGPLPSARAGEGAAYDVAHNRMIIYGGHGVDIAFNDVWILQNANGLTGTPTWTQLAPGGNLPPENYGSIAYDPTNNQIVAWDSSNFANFNGAWTLSNADGLGGTPVWTELSPTGTFPSPRGLSSMVYSPTNQMTVFGGYVGNTYTADNQVWTLSDANGLGGTPTWTQLNPTGAAPAGRAASPATYNPNSGIMTVFDGTDNSTIFDDVWVLPIPSPMVVTDTADASQQYSGTDNPIDTNGLVSLRSAIAAANVDSASGISDTITFASSLNGDTLGLSQGQLEVTAGNGTVTIDGGDQITVSGNNASRVFQVDFGCSLTISNLTLEDGYAGSSLPPPHASEGGAILNEGQLSARSCVFLDNQAATGGSGGAIHNDGQLAVAFCTFTGNSAPNGVGGAILNHNYQYPGAPPTLSIDSSTFVGNSAGVGGALWNYTPASTTIVNSTFTANQATITGQYAQYAKGGAIYNYGPMTIENSTIVGNSTSGYAGGISNGYMDHQYNYPPYPPYFGWIDAPYAITMGNTIVAGNTAAAPPPYNVADYLGPVASQGYNLIGINTSGYTYGSYYSWGWTASDQVGIGTVIDPKVGQLLENGGPTPTMALLSGSPAINAGNPNFNPPPSNDQRGPGFDRVAGGRIDIGAFEVQPAAAQTSTSITAPTVSYGNDLEVTVTVSSSSATPTGNVTLSVDGGTAVSEPLSGGSASFDVGILNAGDHSLSAVFDAQNGFLQSTQTGNLHVNKADATVVVAPYTVGYNGSPHTATYTLSGVNGESGATVGTVTLNTTHTNAGTYSGDTWSFTGAANYNDIANTTIADIIGQADASVVVSGYTGGTYDGNAHTQTVTVTGVGSDGQLYTRPCSLSTTSMPW